MADTYRSDDYFISSPEKGEWFMRVGDDANNTFNFRGGEKDALKHFANILRKEFKKSIEFEDKVDFLPLTFENSQKPMQFGPKQPDTRQVMVPIHHFRLIDPNIASEEEAAENKKKYRHRDEPAKDQKKMKNILIKKSKDGDESDSTVMAKALAGRK